MNHILGLPPAETLFLSVKPKPLPKHFTVDRLFIEAEKNRLDLMALKQGYNSQETQLYQAVLGQFPRVNLGITRAQDNTGVDSLGPNISFDFPIFNRNRGAIAVADATREQLYQEYVARLHQTRSDIAVLLADLNQNHQAQLLLIKALPDIQKAVNAMQQQLNNSNITLLTYQEIYTSLVDKKLKLLALKQSEAEQMVALQIAVGKQLF